MDLFYLLDVRVLCFKRFRRGYHACDANVARVRNMHTHANTGLSRAKVKHSLTCVYGHACLCILETCARAYAFVELGGLLHALMLAPARISLCDAVCIHVDVRAGDDMLEDMCVCMRVVCLQCCGVLYLIALYLAAKW